MPYTGFSKLAKDLAKKGVRDPKALAASIGRKKYGKAKFQAAAAAGKKLKGQKSKTAAFKKLPKGGKTLRGTNKAGQRA